MKKISVLIFFMLSSSFAFAETIHLKDGSTLNAKILKKDAQGVKIDLNGVTMTYYPDEIQDIDGQPLTVIEASKVAPVVTVASPTAEGLMDKRALILEFIEVFGTRTAMEHNFEGMVRIFEQRKPEEAKKIRERFKVNEVIERLIPVYDKYFTSEDLKEYIAFYSAPKGQKLISNIGLIMKESITVGTDYLKEKFPDMINEN